MGKGRAPCCDKTQVKRGPWSPAEDLRLVAFIQRNGHENWRSLPKQAGLARCGKSCRLRWINYLRPDVKRGNFTPEEEDTIIKLHQSMGNKWARIASCLPGRTDNEIKNVWNTHLKKKAEMKESSSKDVSNSNITSSSSSPTSSSSSCNKSNACKAKRKIDQLLVEDHHMTKNPNCEQNKTVIAPSEDTATMSDESHVTNVVHRDMINKKVSSEEVNKPLVGFVDPEDSNINVLDIPNLEADFDLWSMLDMDNLASCVEDSSFGREAEQKKWLEDLETELGLEATTEKQSHDHMFAENDVIGDLAYSS